MYPTDGSQYVLAANKSDGSALLTFSFVTPVTSVGMSIADFGDRPSTGSLIFGNDLGDSFVIAATPPTLADGNLLFFGIVNQSQPFSTITLTKETFSDGIAIDEIYFTAVPEPSTLVLAGVGFGALLVLIRSRRRCRVRRS